MNAELSHEIVGVNWNFSQNIRDNVMESLSGVKGDNSVKIIGPDLNDLEKLAAQLKTILEGIHGIRNVGIFRVKGQPNLEIPVDPKKCNAWGISVSDVEDVVQSAVGGKPCSQMIEGEKRFDITLRWPEALRSSEQAILNIPVDISNNQLVSGLPSTQQTTTTGAATGLSKSGVNVGMPSITGSEFGGTFNNLAATPRRRLGDLVTPLNDQGQHDPKGNFIRFGASTIYREQGNRLIAVKFIAGRSDIDPESIPEALTELPQWVVWKMGERDGKQTKLPFNARTQRLAQSTNPGTWAPFGVALSMSRRGYAGTWLRVFAADDPFVGIDLDGCRNPETGEIAPWASAIIATLDTYGEISPSGSGVKLFARGKLIGAPGGKYKWKVAGAPPMGGKMAGIELYDRERYFAVTGWRIEGPAELQRAASRDRRVIADLPEATKKAI